MSNEGGRLTRVRLAFAQQEAFEKAADVVMHGVEAQRGRPLPLIVEVPACLWGVAMYDRAKCTEFVAQSLIERGVQAQAVGGGWVLVTRFDAPTARPVPTARRSAPAPNVRRITLDAGKSRRM